MDLKELQNNINPENHWYYQSKKLPLLNFFKRKFKNSKTTVIDVGAGSGFFSKELMNNYRGNIAKIYLVDTGYQHIETSHQQNNIIEKTTQLPDTINNSLLVMMDILEHLPDDLSLLGDIKLKSKGENYFFITVPAFTSLWSRHDVFLGHYRRYTLRSLKNTLVAAGFKVESIYYIYGSIFPLVWLKRRLLKSKSIKSDMVQFNPLLDSFLKIVCRFEMNFCRFNKLFGVSCVAEGKI